MMVLLSYKVYHGRGRKSDQHCFQVQVVKHFEVTVESTHFELNCSNLVISTPTTPQNALPGLCFLVYHHAQDTNTLVYRKDILHKMPSLPQRTQDRHKAPRQSNCYSKYSEIQFVSSICLRPRVHAC